VAENKSIFDHPFYGPLLAGGLIESDLEIPSDLLDALAVVVGRIACCSVRPMECTSLAALVVLGLLEKGVLFPSPLRPSEHIEQKTSSPERIQNTLTVPEGAKQLHAA